MNGKRQLVMIAAAILAFTGTAVAGEIYKFVDEEGNVHYVDRPPADPSVERVNISSSSTTSASVNRQVDSYTAQREARAEQAETRAEEAKNAQTAAAEREAMQTRCAEYRAKLQSYLGRTRLYREGENGERVYLDDDERLEARAKTEELISKNCSS